MTGLVSALRTHLADIAPVYPAGRVPASVIQAMTVHQVSSVPALDYEGSDNSQQCRVQVDCYNSSHDLTFSDAEAVEDRLHGFQGSLGGIRVHLIEAQGIRDFSTVSVWRMSQDLLITYQKPEV